MDSQGKVIFEHTTASAGNSIVFSSPELTVGSTCTLKIGDKEYQIDLSNVSTSVNINK